LGEKPGGKKKRTTNYRRQHTEKGEAFGIKGKGDQEKSKQKRRHQETDAIKGRKTPETKPHMKKRIKKKWAAKKD